MPVSCVVFVLKLSEAKCKADGDKEEEEEEEEKEEKEENEEKEEREEREETEEKEEREEREEKDDKDEKAEREEKDEEEDSDHGEKSDQKSEEAEAEEASPISEALAIPFPELSLFLALLAMLPLTCCSMMRDGMIRSISKYYGKLQRLMQSLESAVQATKTKRAEPAKAKAKALCVNPLKRGRTQTT